MVIGVLALQGAFREHLERLHALGVEAREVRLPADLEGLDGLIIPGGESTTIGRLAELYGFMEPLRAFAAGRPVWGTCAGMIFMAKAVGRAQPGLALMDIEVERNAFGRQVDSFESDLEVAALEDGAERPFPAVFIRAPRLVAADGEAGVEVLARLEDGTAVAARQGHWLVTSFHPELSGDDRFHRYFIRLVERERAREAAA
ncbi:MAG: pyridoxal 5'-phosphate synthase glutaminase subunit PdxT [Candidatus Promineifilaceae bacterium]